MTTHNVPVGLGNTINGNQQLMHDLLIDSLYGLYDIMGLISANHFTNYGVLLSNQRLAFTTESLIRFLDEKPWRLTKWFCENVHYTRDQEKYLVNDRFIYGLVSKYHLRSIELYEQHSEVLRLEQILNYTILDNELLKVVTNKGIEIPHYQRTRRFVNVTGVHTQYLYSVEQLDAEATKAEELFANEKYNKVLESIGITTEQLRFITGLDNLAYILERGTVFRNSLFTNGDRLSELISVDMVIANYKGVLALVKYIGISLTADVLTTLLSMLHSTDEINSRFMAPDGMDMETAEKYESYLEFEPLFIGSSDISKQIPNYPIEILAANMDELCKRYTFPTELLLRIANHMYMPGSAPKTLSAGTPSVIPTILSTQELNKETRDELIKIDAGNRNSMDWGLGNTRRQLHAITSYHLLMAADEDDRDIPLFSRPLLLKNKTNNDYIVLNLRLYKTPLCPRLVTITNCYGTPLTPYTKEMTTSQAVEYIQHIIYSHDAEPIENEVLKEKIDKFTDYLAYLGYDS